MARDRQSVTVIDLASDGETEENEEVELVGTCPLSMPGRFARCILNSTDVQ